MKVLIGVRQNGDYDYYVHPYPARWSAWHEILRAVGFEYALCSVPTENEARDLVTALNAKSKKR
jgi:hypothetical protein